MCGIFGYINFDPVNKVEREILIKMRDALTHRGPDGSDFYMKDNIGFGHNRLAIIDLENGRQPISNEDRTIWLTFNGEVYNYLHLSEELKKRGHVLKTNVDCEVLVHLYEEEGIRFLNKINGMFSFALWDSKVKKFFLTRDRFGIKPLYYYVGKDILVFGSELKSILAHPAVDKKIDFISMHHYFVYGYTPDPMSMFKNIKKVSPANYLYFYRNTVSLETYWKSVPLGGKKYEEKICIEELASLLENSVKERLISDVPLGIFLSGGIDSSIISYLAVHQCRTKVKIFSISVDDTEYDESQYAKSVAKSLNAEHFTKMISSKEVTGNARQILEMLDEPLADSSFIPTYLLSSFARTQVKVCLSGDGGDELFAGYPTYAAQSVANIYKKLPYFIRKYVLRKIIDTIPIKNSNNKIDFLLRLFIKGAEYEDIERNIVWFGYLSPYEMNGLFTEGIREYLKRNDVFKVVKDYVSNLSVRGLLEKQLLVDRRFFLGCDILVKTDRASMANSLEVRVPYLDHRVVEFVDSLPANFKLRGLTNKYILKKAFRNKIPNRILHRKKQGFNVAIGKLLKQGLLNEFVDILSEDVIRHQGIFEHRCIKNMISEHLSSKNDNRRPIWSIIAFQVWFNKYFGLR